MLAVGLALALLTASVSADNTTGSWRGVQGCRFEVPPDWPSASLTWAGGCSQGLADGRGVLRAYQRNAVVRTFFGRLHRGQLQFGVTRLEGGYAAGHYAAGRLVPGAEREELLLAFDEASLAAAELARYYREQGKKDSARLYEDEARRLAEQID